MTTSGNIAKRWKELSGEGKWKGLLDPLDLDLRRYILHYGEMAQVTYDSFNYETKSKYAGFCYYSRKHLFARTGHLMNNPYRYKVVKYFYATSKTKLPACFIVKSLTDDACDQDSNWFGYIAVATDKGKAELGRRDIVVAWRGTIQLFEWASDFDYPLTSASSVFPGVHADHQPLIADGWLSIYTSVDSHSPYTNTCAREQVLEKLRQLLEEYKNEEVSITVVGHSLGAVLAALTAADIVYNRHNKVQDYSGKPCPVTVFGFGSPQVGDRNFKRLVDSLDSLNILRIKNLPDLAPRYPLVGYVDTGEELLINTLQSKYLKASANWRHWHNLEVYLHGVAGTQGSQEEFKLEIKRDIALVNKFLDDLKDDYLVPCYWWCVANKGMAQMDDGSWKLINPVANHEDEEDSN